MMKMHIQDIKYLLITIVIITLGSAQYNFTLEDVNPTSETYGQEIGPSSYPGIVTLYYFTHQN